MSGILFIKDLPKEYQGIANSIDTIDDNDKRRIAERQNGGFSSANDGKLEGIEYSLFYKSLKKEIKQRVLRGEESLLNQSAVEMFTDNLDTFAEKRVNQIINSAQKLADIRAGKGNFIERTAYKIGHFLGLIG